MAGARSACRSQLVSCGDAEEDQRVGAYRAVLDAVAALRSAGSQLEAAHDWNQPPKHELFAPTNDALKKTYDLIEQKRDDTGPVFATAARQVVEYWDRASDLLWERDYTTGINPPLPERDSAMYATIPVKYRARVAPGYFEDREIESASNRQLPGAKQKTLPSGHSPELADHMGPDA